MSITTLWPDCQSLKPIYLTFRFCIPNRSKADSNLEGFAPNGFFRGKSARALSLLSPFTFTGVISTPAGVLGRGLEEKKTVVHVGPGDSLTAHINDHGGKERERDREEGGGAQVRLANNSVVEYDLNQSRKRRKRRRSGAGIGRCTRLGSEPMGRTENALK